jgi:acetyltransferase-like isoleucine patch superfamily enzyme
MILIYYLSKIIKKLHIKAVIKSDIHSTSKIEAGSEIIDSKMGRHSFCGYFCEIVNTDIGSFCSIANHVIIGGGMHPINWVSTSPVFYEGRDSVKAKFSNHRREPHKKTIIGHDVWIGERSIIKQGITIGTGAVVGMGSVVTKDVPPYSIVAGCPAKQIRKRFDEVTIGKLLKTEWWLLHEDELKKYARYIINPPEFIRNLNL